jgi:hypothetical protein
MLSDDAQDFEPVKSYDWTDRLPRLSILESAITQPSHLSNSQQILHIGHFLPNLTSLSTYRFQSPILWQNLTFLGKFWHIFYFDILAAFWPIVVFISFIPNII